MGETMSARIYGDKLVMLTDDPGGMWAFTTQAKGLLQNEATEMKWTPGQQVSTKEAGFTNGYEAVALRILPGTGSAGAKHPTHAALGWRGNAPKSKGCHGGMRFAVFPLA